MNFTLSTEQRQGVHAEDVVIHTDSVLLEGELEVPPNALGIVVLIHGSGSSRHSPRNQFVARVIRSAGIGTLLFDLLTRREEIADRTTRRLTFDIDKLAERVTAAAHWIEHHPATSGLRIGLFGSSTGGAAALVSAANLGHAIGAVVSRGGRPDLAGDCLESVASPTLLIVGGLDEIVLQLNKEALAAMRCKKKLRIVPGATHLFEEHGALDEVAELAAD